jgi:hypothetical protein
MKTEFWIIVNENGSVHTRKTKPDLSRNEVAVRMGLNLPDTLFHRPLLQADITVDPDQVATYPMDAEVIQGIKQAVLESTGVDLNIKLLDPHEEEL